MAMLAVISRWLPAGDWKLVAVITLDTRKKIIYKEHKVVL
ncbi:MAG: hypothetical protein UT37_C0008G0036 [Parcubacteria group bacterium GW2011_GWA2_39_18]|nr:MAG: hypothetical protein UT37_C0008G0036 [Parcubacteria group bacterium GW2011_GWA2_39_18]